VLLGLVMCPADVAAGLGHWHVRDADEPRAEEGRSRLLVVAIGVISTRLGVGCAAALIMRAVEKHGQLLY
jgi:hypothetical protein